MRSSRSSPGVDNESKWMMPTFLSAQMRRARARENRSSESPPRMIPEKAPLLKPLATSLEI